MYRRTIPLVLLAAVLCGCQPGSSKQQATLSPEGQLADKTGCFACHSIDKNLLGPSWKAVADRFRGNPEAEAYLMIKIADGGKGAWGNIAMPAYPEGGLLSETDRRILVKYILSLN
jgi:cytochrome c